MRSLSRGGIRAAVFQLCPVCELAPFSTPSTRHWHQGGSFPGFARWVNQRPFPHHLPRSRRQSGSFPLSPVGESEPLPCTVCPGSGVRAAVFRLYPVGESTPLPRTICPGTGVRAAVPRLCPVGELAPFSHPRQLGTGVRAAVSPPCAWAVTGTACHPLSGALRCEILPLFPALSLSCVKNARCILSKNSPVRPVLLHQL